MILQGTESKNSSLPNFVTIGVIIIVILVPAGIVVGGFMFLLESVGSPHISSTKGQIVLMLFNLFGLTGSIAFVILSLTLRLFTGRW